MTDHQEVCPALPDIPTRLLRGHPDCTLASAAYVDDAITLRDPGGRQHKRRKHPNTVAMLKSLSYTSYAIGKMDCATGERTAWKRITAEGTS